MSRARLSDYAGATSRLDPQEGLALDPDRFGFQEKKDGAYAQISTDAHGRISSVLSQSGAPLHGAQDLIGIVAGPPFSTLVGECDLHTESGIAAARARGYACLHLFDALRVDGRYLARLPYLERRAALFAAQSWVESEGRSRRRDWTLDARGNAHATVASGSRVAAPIERGGAIGRPSSTPKAIGAGRRAARPGTFVSPVPRDLRRLPILPLHRGADAARALWSSVESTGAEGLVAVRLDAPIGRRGAKVKIKSTDTLDCYVVSSDRTAAIVRARVASDAASIDRVRWRVVEFTVAGCHAVGSIVEVAHNGWHDSGAPRFARVVRQRTDKERLAS